MSRNSLWTIGGLVLFAATSVAQPKFEVASIKPSMNPREARLAGVPLHAGTRIDDARVDMGSASLLMLIATAYKVEPYQITGPDWMGTTRFDILAKIPDGVSKAQVPEMIRALLEERFGLVARRETKDQPVYVLVARKGGIKLKQTDPDAKPSDLPFPNGLGGRIILVRGGGPGEWRTYSKLDEQIVFDALKITMPEFARAMMAYVDVPVLDKTDLPGSYDVVAMPVPGGPNLNRQAATPGRAGGGGDLPPAEASIPSGVSIFKSVEKLGLKLEKRTAPLERIVVDHLEKTPTGN
jgi:uncharacterized protein (TIGR03435 family)